MTLIAGFAMGALKEWSNNTFFAIVPHVIFDIIVYGDNMVPPWWIWA
jgi:hypothetical protein